MQDVPQTTDATTQTPDLADRLQPRSMGELMEWAEQIHESRLCPEHFESPSDVVLVAQQGVELGLTVMTALQNSHVIHGQVGWDADLLKALCEQTGTVERWDYEQCDSRACIVTVQRAGREPQTFQWTREKAKHAGLWSKGVWQSYPDDMLRHRADATAARSVWPDVVAGVYTPNEVREIQRHESTDAELVGGAGDDSEPDPTDPDALEADLLEAGADDASTETGTARQTDPDDGPSDEERLTSARRSIGQMLRKTDLSEAEKDLHRKTLQSAGLWEDPESLEQYREDLRDADDRAAFVRDRIEVEASDEEADDDTDAPQQTVDKMVEGDPLEQERMRLYRVCKKVSLSDERIKDLVRWICKQRDVDTWDDLDADRAEEYVDKVAEQSPEPRKGGPPERVVWINDRIA